MTIYASACFKGRIKRKWVFIFYCKYNYSDIVLSAMTSQITSLTIVYSTTIYPGADQPKHQSTASLAFVVEFIGDRWIPRTKGK